MTINDVIARLKEHNNFLILTHIRPDGDTIGSGAALCNALQISGKTAWLYPNPQFGDCYPWLSEGFIAPEGYKYDYIVAVDLASEEMLPKGFSGHVDLCVDHHTSNSHYAGETYVETDRASCGEIILEIVKGYCGELNKFVADQLYVAVSTDCGCFAYGNTNANTHRAAMELYESGANLPALNKVLFRTSSKARIALEGMIYANLRYYHDGMTCLAVLTRDMMAKAGAQEKDCSDIAALPGRVEGVGSSAVLKETEDGHCKVSLRTTGEIDANKVCAVFGGGGHPMAAGCCLKMPPEQACEILAQAIAEGRKAKQ